jgi:DNA-directed RNA polymerase subunit H (RpoH/RPB5)
LQNCWLGGDERIKTDDDLFLAANAVLGDLIKIKTATLKNC